MLALHQNIIFVVGISFLTFISTINKVAHADSTQPEKAVHGFVNATFDPPSSIYLENTTTVIWDGPSLRIGLNISYILPPVQVTSEAPIYSLDVFSLEESILRITNISDTLANLTFKTSDDISHITSDLWIEVSGKRLGQTFLRFKVKTKNNISIVESDTEIKLPSFDYRVNVKRTITVHETIFRVIITFMVVAMTLLMGCELDLKIIIAYFKRPIAPCIGFVSQFVFMPLIAFTITQIVPMEKEFGFGLLTIGCSPGGGSSNMWTILLGGDLNLSMTMTFLSTVFALGIMPFWMFALGRFYINFNDVTIPYSMIALNLVQVVVPSAIGICLRFKFPKVAIKMAKAIKPFALFFIIYIFTYGVYVNLYMFKLIGYFPFILPIAAALPWAGFFFGFLLAFIFRQTRAQQIAISIETGIQNIGIAIIILLYSMPFPMGELGAVMPLMVSLFTPLPLYIIGLVLCTKHYKNKHKKFKIAKESESKTTDSDVKIRLKTADARINSDSYNDLRHSDTPDVAMLESK